MRELYIQRNIQLSLPILGLASLPLPRGHISSISLPSSSNPNSGKSPTSTLSALTKTPLFFPHWKYRSPDGTLPSFLPAGSSSVMPIQGAPAGPGNEGMAPMKETVPRLVDESVRRQRAVGWISGVGG